jgi:hypothetical protein
MGSRVRDHVRKLVTTSINRPGSVLRIRFRHGGRGFIATAHHVVDPRPGEEEVRDDERLRLTIATDGDHAPAWGVVLTLRAVVWHDTAYVYQILPGAVPGEKMPNLRTRIQLWGPLPNPSLWG